MTLLEMPNRNAMLSRNLIFILKNKIPLDTQMGNCLMAGHPKLTSLMEKREPNQLTGLVRMHKIGYYPNDLDCKIKFRITEFLGCF
jgi:hypothetical protein